MSLFNRNNQPRSPPSAFKLSGVSSSDRSHRRVSRTQDDFEAALRNEDTVVLQEGRDMRTLGSSGDTPHRNRSGSVNLSAPRPSVDAIGRRQTVSTPKHSATKQSPAPATPVVVPPTPTAPDEDDSRRRSMYRAAGTASSPDLATLISKARHSREEQPEERERTKSTTSSAFEIIEAHTPAKSRDRSMTSPDSQPHRRTTRLTKAEKTLGISPGASSKTTADSDIGEGRSDREGKRSMRNKTSAFFGKMLGQGSVRGSNRSTPTTPVATQQHSFAPPVPTLPAEYRSSPPHQTYFPPNNQQPSLGAQYTDSPAQTPNLPPADPFISATPSPQTPLIPASSTSQPMNGTRHTKPLPPIHKQFPPAPVDDRSDTDDDTPLAPPKPPGQIRSKPTLEGRSRPSLDPKPRIPSETRPRTTGGASRDAVGASTSGPSREHDQNATLTQRSHARPPFPRQGKDGRRRSMSVGDIDIQKLLIETRQRKDGNAPRASVDEGPVPRASMDDALVDGSESDEDRTEEGHPPRAPEYSPSPVNQKRMSRRARAVNAWAQDMELSTLVDGFGGELQDALGGIRSSPHRSNFPASVQQRGYALRPVRQSEAQGSGQGMRVIPSSPLAARRQSNASSSSMLAVPGTYPASSSGQTLTNQPSMESMRTVSSETAGTYITPPSSAILDSSSSTPPATSPALGANRPLPSANAPVALSTSLPPRSSSLRLSPRALPRRQPPRHRSAASASEPSLLEGIASGPTTSIRLVSDQISIRKDSSRERDRDQRLVSDPVSWQNHRVDEEDAPSKVDRRGSTSGASMDIEGRGQGLAARCWQEDEAFLVKEKIAEWLGGTAAINKIALRYYMDYFDFGGMRLDAAFRHLFNKLYLKAETQQVDRILEEFSRRFWDCNRGTVYGSPSIVHAIAYSLLLLNTDLHIAELSSHMSKNQFVRNTWAVIQDQIRAPELPKSPGSGSGSNGMEPLKSPIHIERGQASQEQLRSQAHLAGESTPELILDEDGSQLGDGGEHITRKHRSGSLNSWRSGSREGGQMSLNASNPSVMDGSDPKTPTGSMHAVVSARGWDSEMELLLKDMYNSVKNQQILQPLSGLSPPERQSMSLSPGMTSLGRTRSQRSHVSPGGDRITSLKRGSIRGLQSLLGTQSPYGSNTSVDGRISPSPSFATSIGEGVQTSNSNLFAPTLGFASNLSHTIIKEAQEDDVGSVKSDVTNSTIVSITDEELALLGPPWAKEGMLCRKQYWESAGKRAKIKTWMDVFVVIQKGELSMFVFGETSANAGDGVTVGGGNWLSNANCVGKVVLAHALAHSLPPPGYNRQRPHCFVLTLASGAVFFFQAGTEDLVNEWVMTCNYWAARQSKEPLSGGVSNMEYGWNRALELIQSGNVEDRRVDSSDAQSMRSGRNVNLRMPPSPYSSERIIIHDWTGPMHSVMPSTHDEETQMEALQKQANLLKRELHVHNELRQPMMSLYVPRSANAIKASNNWERRSQYLLSEIVKYDSYVESLRSAMSQRLKRRGEKALECALVASRPDDDDLEGLIYAAPTITGSGPTARLERGATGSVRGRHQVIHEDEEPLTPLPGATSSISRGRR
ncbi:unnamed protein product [Rhizoctonia solani]|uniref:SEC7 domain-containing protein n=1 Tax=Rhizoctonia solani TaxID=456999 RepID=A0A8H3HSD0_9AGAM|nr:unnamed protein product [Rhizoctonia solani]